MSAQFTIVGIIEHGYSWLHFEKALALSYDPDLKQLSLDREAEALTTPPPKKG